MCEWKTRQTFTNYEKKAFGDSSCLKLNKNRIKILKEFGLKREWAIRFSRQKSMYKNTTRKKYFERAKP